MTAPPANSNFLTIGSLISWGKSWRICATALRTSLVAWLLSVPRIKLTVVVELPSVTTDVI